MLISGDSFGALLGDWLTGLIILPLLQEKLSLPKWLKPEPRQFWSSSKCVLQHIEFGLTNLVQLSATLTMPQQACFDRKPQRCILHMCELAQEKHADTTAEHVCSRAFHSQTGIHVRWTTLPHVFQSRKNAETLWRTTPDEMLGTRRPDCGHRPRIEGKFAWSNVSVSFCLRFGRNGPGNSKTNHCMPSHRFWPKTLLARPGSTWLDLARPGSTWLDLARPGSTWLDLARPGSTWLDLGSTLARPWLFC